MIRQSTVFARVVALTAGVLATAACGGDGGRATAAPTEDRAVVLVTLEMRGEEGPLDGPALREFVRFDDFVTASPQARPAVTTMLTGQTPDRHGVRTNVNHELAADAAYLPAALAEAGWTTVAFVGNPRLDRRSGLDRGFSIYDVPIEVPYGPMKYVPALRDPGDVVDHFETWLDQAPERPWFAWVHLAGTVDRVEHLEQREDWTADAPRKDLSAVSAAKRLLRDLREGGRMEGTAVVVAGVSGPLAAEDGARSGYFLGPDVLRAPLAYRPVALDAATLDAGADAWAPDVAAILAAEAGVEPASGPGLVPTRDASPEGPGRTRHAWTWAGAYEFAWPAETAAVANGWWVVVEGPEALADSGSWTQGTTSSSSPPPDALVESARSRAPAPGRAHWPEPEIPGDLLRDVADHGIDFPEEVEPYVPPSREVRAQVLSHALRGRRIFVLRRAHGQEVLEQFRAARELDPDNPGLAITLGEVLVGRVRRARRQLERAIPREPYNPHLWHALGHVAYVQEQLGLAEAVWHLAEHLAPGEPDVLYDLACMRSLEEDLDAAEDYLRRAWHAGYQDIDRIQADPDLRNLRADARFARFMQEVVR